MAVNTNFNVNANVIIMINANVIAKARGGFNYKLTSNRKIIVYDEEVKVIFKSSVEVEIEN